MPDNPRRHNFAPGDRVKILTKTDGCYNGATGIVTAKLAADFTPDPNAEIPHFYQIRTDHPINISCGVKSHEDIHPSRQVFPFNTPLKNYWDTGS